MADAAWSRSIKPLDIARFFQLLPSRAPAGSGESAEARGRMALAAARLNAAMLGRELDTRVPRDLEILSEQLASRAKRYTSDDWSRPVGDQTLLRYAQEVVAEISLELRGHGDDQEDTDDWATDDWATDEMEP